jgi:uncharacterized DUF497 family protein
MPPRFRRIWRSFGPADFIWDPAKSDANLAQRGFDFGFASLIFQGAVVERRDTRHKDEVRFQAIGNAGGAILFVVYTIRDQHCRIISARVATALEAALYHG